MEGGQQKRGLPSAPAIAGLFRRPVRRLTRLQHSSGSKSAKSAERKHVEKIGWLLNQLVEEKDYDT